MCPLLVEGKSGLVTGAASGIGRATAIAFAQEGASVVVSDLPDAHKSGEETVRAIKELGGQAAFFACDVSKASDQQALVEYVIKTFGRLDFAHNNAGIELHNFLHETKEEDFDRTIEVNLRGVWLGMKYQIPKMMEQGGGAIVNTASLAGLLAAPALGAYCASKHGVIGLTKTAAVEYAEHNIRVNAVCPAAINTPMMDRTPLEMREELVAPQAIKRYGAPEEVAAAVVWLCSDQASFITGVPLPVDAGATAGI